MNPNHGEKTGIHQTTQNLRALPKVSCPIAICEKTVRMAEILIQITLRDALITSFGSRMPSPYTCKILLRVPETWIENNKLIEKGKEKIFQTFYGPGWKIGNPDGSRYIVNEYEETVLKTPEAIQSIRQETEAEPDTKIKWWFNSVDESGKVVTCEKNKLFPG